MFAHRCVRLILCRLIATLRRIKVESAVPEQSPGNGSRPSAVGLSLGAPPQLNGSESIWP